MKKNVVVIAGPTGSGKTALSVEIAKRFGGEIISADSMQIYKYMDIGSAKVTEEEKQGIPHHLLDFLDPTLESFSVADYVELAKEKIEEILNRGKLPIVVGGTGLYISSLADNIEFADSEKSPEIRERLAKLAEEKGNSYVHDMLKEIDPEMAEKVHENNIKRVIRAIEIFEMSGITLTEQNARSKENPSPYNFIMIALTDEREKMYERINKRVDVMMEAGLVSEVKKLKNLGCSKEMQAMQGIGYKEVFEFLEGNITEDELSELIKKNTRNYAKRQITWFKRDKRYLWLNVGSGIPIDDAMYYIKNKLIV